QAVAEAPALHQLERTPGTGGRYVARTGSCARTARPAPARRFDAVGSHRDVRLRRFGVRSTLPMDAGAIDQIHEQESLRSVSGRPAEGARRDAETAEGAHRRGGAGG